MRFGDVGWSVELLRLHNGEISCGLEKSPGGMRGGLCGFMLAIARMPVSRAFGRHSYEDE